MQYGNGQTLESEDAKRAGRHSGVVTREPSYCDSFVHVLSHRRLEVHVWHGKAARAEAHEDLRLFSAEELEDVGIATLTRKMLEQAGFI